MRGKEGYYYPKTTKQMLIAVVNIFKDIVVYNYDKNGDITSEVDVEILVNPVEAQYRARTNDQQMEYVPTFPRIEINHNGMNFDESRLISPNNERFWNNENVTELRKDHQDTVLLELNGAFKDFMPIPYNYEYTVKIYTEKMDHYAQIVENIFPYFALYNSTLRVKEFSFLNIERDINIILGNPDFTVEADVLGDDVTRDITCTFTVSLHGFIYRKVRSSKIVSTVAYAIINQDDNTVIAEVVLPGEE